MPANAYGPTYGAHREPLEFTVDQHRRLKEVCEEWGVHYSSSVWDMTSAHDIAGLQPAFIKVPSATNTHLDLLRFLCDHFGGEIHVSLSMTTRAEEARIVETIAARRRLEDTVLYACTSGYPVAFDELCLLEIRRLRRGSVTTVKAIGFSGHHLASPRTSPP